MSKLHKPKALDLFCGAGGATRGLQEAGFEVYGIDIKPQPRYCGNWFIQGDALELGGPLWYKNFDLVWASPPCQRYTKGAAQWTRQHQHPNLIAATRRRLQSRGVPYIIENVEGAHVDLVRPILLCGTQFNLGVFRHRLFEISFPCHAPSHPQHEGKIGDGRYVTVAGHSGGPNALKDQACIAMGIDWMSWREMTQAIPPAYARYLGQEFLKYKSLPPL